MNNRFIVMVEDNPDDAELISTSLQSSHLANQLVWLEDGAQALDFFFCRGQYCDRNINDYPAVVLLDIMLPKINGMEVLRQLRADERTRTIPVVILTSSKEDRDLLKSYNLGCNSYVQKPVIFEDFVSAVRNLGLYWLLLNEPPIPPRAK